LALAPLPLGKYLWDAYDSSSTFCASEHMNIIFYVKQKFFSSKERSYHPRALTLLIQSKNIPRNKK